MIRKTALSLASSVFCLPPLLGKREVVVAGKMGAVVFYKAGAIERQGRELAKKSPVEQESFNGAVIVI